MKRGKHFNLNEKNPNIVKAKGLGDPTCVHHCPSCGAYLWADENHYSYNHCCYCGINLKGKKLPFERI